MPLGVGNLQEEGGKVCEWVAYRKEVALAKSQEREDTLSSYLCFERKAMSFFKFIHNYDF